MHTPREFLSQAGNLKELKRWSHPHRTIDNAESVADHTFRATLLALLLPRDASIDRDKVIRMLIVHDLPESDPTVGDITPYDRVPPQEKRRWEEEAMHKLCALLPNGSEIWELWQEYEANETEEARTAHDIDKLERSLQAKEYAAKGNMSPRECTELIQHDCELPPPYGGGLHEFQLMLSGILPSLVLDVLSDDVLVHSHSGNEIAV